MPNVSRGPRIAITVRLPFDEYREVARRARNRRWSMSDYVGYCISRELRGRPQIEKVNKDVVTTPADLALMREFPEFIDGE